MSELESNFEIRLANSDDIDGILKVDKELGGLHPTLDAKVKTMLNNPNSYFMVGMYKGEIVGYVGGTIRETEFGNADPIGYITHVGLSKGFASKGMGRMLGDRLIDKMSLKCEIFRTILSFERNDLQSFFNHLGFKKTDLMVYEHKF
ncbi:MAG: GNAT family N-acetyltransferase [Candidatus Heimdallarchaeota archaeon]|nr:GNAT family N-acetyltransferase [Candidatus Heimdallarchaeota archaeon]MDH5647504.1 GNAT family N-acetyltransferase [Candidatus Heimdallarchaeota archaeon]